MTDTETTKQNAREAASLLSSPIFQKTLDELKRRLDNELMASTPERTIEVVAMLRALKAIPQQLAVFVNGGKVLTQRENTNGRQRR